MSQISGFILAAMLAIVVFALLTLSGLHAGKIVWDNDIDSFYPDYDFWQARDGESRAPNWFLIFPGKLNNLV